MELVLAGMVARRTAYLAALAAIARRRGPALARRDSSASSPPACRRWRSAYLALATASVVPVCVGVGALASQLAPTRRAALELGGAVVGVLFLARVVADTASGLGWLRWATPLGWAEELRPFAGPQPLVLAAPRGRDVAAAHAGRMDRRAPRHRHGPARDPRQRPSPPAAALLADRTGAARRAHQPDRMARRQRARSRSSSACSPRAPPPQASPRA